MRQHVHQGLNGPAFALTPLPNRTCSNVEFGLVSVEIEGEPILGHLLANLEMVLAGRDCPP